MVEGDVVEIMAKRICSFQPIIFDDSKILILGSIPGRKSLELNQYYGHPQNQFWKIIFYLFGEVFTEDYTTKISILEKNKIALWDVIDSCERKGSLDSEIRNEISNNISELLIDYPNIKVVFCNGQKAFKTLKKIHSELKIPVYLLPSTSPLHTISFERKLEEWKKITNY